MDAPTFRTLLDRYKHLLLPLGFFVVGLVFVADFWLGWFGGSRFCPEEQTRCSIAASSAFIEKTSTSGSLLQGQGLSSRVSLEIGSLMELLRSTPELGAITQEANSYLTPLTEQIVAAVSADPTVYTLLQRGHVTPQEERYIIAKMRLALLEQLESFIAQTTQAEEGELRARVEAILPESLTSFALSSAIESRTSTYLKPGDTFLLENVQFGATKQDGNIFTTINGTMTVQGTLSPLIQLVRDLGTSGDLQETPAPNRAPLPLLRLLRLSLTPQGFTTPLSTADVSKTTYRAEILFEAFTRAVTEQDLAPRIEEKKIRAQKVADLTTAGMVLAEGMTLERVDQLRTLAANAERTLDSTLAQKDLTAAKEQTERLIELYDTILRSFRAP